MEDLSDAYGGLSVWTVCLFPTRLYTSQMALTRLCVGSVSVPHIFVRLCCTSWSRISTCFATIQSPKCFSLRSYKTWNWWSLCYPGTPQRSPSHCTKVERCKHAGMFQFMPNFRKWEWIELKLASPTTRLSKSLHWKWVVHGLSLETGEEKRRGVPEVRTSEMRAKQRYAEYEVQQYNMITARLEDGLNIWTEKCADWWEGEPGRS